MRLVAVDTETVRGEPWSVQMATEETPTGEMFMCALPEHMAIVRATLQDPNTLTILHNAKFDLRILSAVGVSPAHCHCSMQLAYLVGELRLSLKVLAYRIAGIQMRTYREVTREATQAKAKEYLERVVGMEWPDPDAIVETKRDGTYHVKQPQNIAKKVARLIKKHSVDPSIDLYDKWHIIDEDGGRRQVEDAIGRMEEAYLDEVEWEVAYAYALLDAEATLAIYPYLWDRLVALGMEDVFELDMAMLPMVMEMEDNGILLDVSVLEELGRELDVLAEDTQTDINYMAGRYVNPRSSQQVVELLQDEGIFTNMEESTDASVLDQFREYPIVGKIQDYRAYTKLQATYVRGLAKQVRADGRVHTRYSTTRTETGRLASSDPNLQNLPVRTELGRRIREAFVAESGCSLLAIDLSQIELRMAAHMSQDPTMLDIYHNDGDIHMTTACHMFGLPPEQIDDYKHRKPAKKVNFQTIYLTSPQGLLTAFQHEGLTEFGLEDCAGFLDSWRQTYPGFFDWVEEIKAEARRTGMVRDMFGRVRFTPEIDSSLKYVREAGIRQAVNAPIQSGAGGILKVAMKKIHPLACEWSRLGVVCRPLLQVHDELIFEVEDDYLDPIAIQFHEAMVSAVELTVPIRADVEVGKNWKELKGYEL
ncbi:MAG: DNA polymerase [Dehalococcoidales bacterium]|nr:DNA polymerase [Dehalococcoidales bacterium]